MKALPSVVERSLNLFSPIVHVVRDLAGAVDIVEGTRCFSQGFEELKQAWGLVLGFAL